MSDTGHGPGSEASSRRRRVYWIGLITLPFLFFATCEGLVRLAPTSLVSDDPNLNLLFVPTFFERVSIEGVDHYRVAHGELYSERGVTFPAIKRDDGFRVFCLGGSASAGWPHPADENWCAYLEAPLARALPDKQVQVINVSAHAYASYRVRLVFQQVMALDPDLILIWSGNNEFLERRTYSDRSQGLERALQAANHSAAFRLARGLAAQFLAPGSALLAQQRQDVMYEQWSKVRRVALELRRDPDQHEQVLEHFRWGIDSMVAEAGRAGVPVVLATVPVNLRDWQPNVSLNRLTGSEREDWNAAYRRGRAALLDGEPAAAVPAFEQAIELEPLHAESFYYLARAREDLSQHARAIAAYQHARDLDHNPFRAGSRLNQDLHAIAEGNRNVQLADLQAAFLEASAPRAPGFDLFLDYVHPTTAGNRIAASTAFDAIRETGLLGPDAGAALFVEPAPSDYDPELDKNVQGTLFWLFGLMHQYESIVDKSRDYLEDRRLSWGYLPRLHRVFSRYLDMQQREIRGHPLPPAVRKKIEADLDRFYREGYDALADEPEAPGSGG